MDIEPGTRVLITEDCREGGRATGQVGIYEGSFPRTVFVQRGEDYGEYELEVFMEWNQAQERPFPSIDDMDFEDDPRPPLPAEDADASVLKKYSAVFGAWWERNEARMAYYAVEDNPRIRLEDGSVIWGAECWWGTADDAPPTLAEAQAQTEETKEFLRLVGEGIMELAEESEAKKTATAFIVRDQTAFRGLDDKWHLPSGAKSTRIYDEGGETWVEFEGGVSFLWSDVVDMDGFIALDA